jgi:membrane protease YdiL (CAAX protease family)
MAEPLWEGLLGQLVWVLLALAGAFLLPGGSLGERLGLGPGRLPLPRLALALAGFLLLSNGLHRAIHALGLYGGTNLAELDRLVRDASPAAPLLVLLAFGLAPALGEELLFRGFLQRLLATRLGGPAAVVGASLLFGLAHLDLVHGAAAGLLGLYLGTLAWRAGSLRAPILCHAVNNGVALLAAQGLVPEAGPVADPWLAALAIALAAACLALATGLLQRHLPPADPAGGPHEDHSSGPPRR